MRKLVPTLFAVALAATLLSGCWRHNYVNTQAVAEVEPAYWSWNHHLLWGIIKLSDDVYIDQVCPAGVARIESWVGPLQVLFYALTGGIYSPTTVRVWCAKPHVVVPVEVQLDERIIGKLQRMYPDLEERLRAELGLPAEGTPAADGADPDGDGPTMADGPAAPAGPAAM